MKSKRRVDKFWQRIAKLELKWIEELAKEFARHEDAIRRILIKARNMK